MTHQHMTLAVAGTFTHTHNPDSTVAPIVNGGRCCVWSLFCYSVLSEIYSLTIILPRKRELVAILWLFS